MAKMKYFGKAMAKVRKAPRGANGKVKDKKLSSEVSKMLAAIRAKNFTVADELARRISVM